jgi:hypothetical protein
MSAAPSIHGSQLAGSRFVNSFTRHEELNSGRRSFAIRYCASPRPRLFGIRQTIVRVRFDVRDGTKDRVKLAARAALGTFFQYLFGQQRRQLFRNGRTNELIDGRSFPPRQLA